VGKLVAAFSMFLAASALAIHESKPPAPPPTATEPAASRAEPAVSDHTPPSRAIHDEVPPWVKYAAPAAPPPPPPPHTVISIESWDGPSGDIPDIVDRCPDEPTSDDLDGCPEPVRGTVRVTTGQEIILVE
jgi:hypothetical protein